MNANENVERLLRDHPFLHGLADRHLSFLSGCARTVTFQPGDFLGREGEEAHSWYLVRHGHVSLETHIEERGPIQVAALGEGEVIGWGWLVAPYNWHFDARAVTVTKTLTLDGDYLRAHCENDPELGYELLKRFLHVLQKRLHWSRTRMRNLARDAS
ncbi:MAG: cyclic nucleotide-binding domain-containing protein [Gemmatimonadota bacterium]|jgi:CRP-like cAMP-binding protein|nr:Crp/Fnr family transcriptional regulator [Gemmatimonadota bacterium]MDP6460658.1 cyclic nucleotide-binding domain-containing protein [Gemmatimonadota bacterium]MDP6528205.1 cyclic nucleotide-binding domain-containing protein [Gemmatimonadota bacterium]MDP6801996.1 cyclic nucleotide-binding domain-containing protein [Gemmatimonadota bacterium]MDP7031344.1 cyclic nucleotide-binding domain-containing protein [Gemmatimonadota bacterium]